MSDDPHPDPGTHHEPVPTAGADAARPAPRLAARRRAEILAHSRTGDVAHAVDLAFEHLCAHGPDPGLLGDLCAAAGDEALDRVGRDRLAELIRHHHPDLGADVDPCAALVAQSEVASAPEPGPEP